MKYYKADNFPIGNIGYIAIREDGRHRRWIHPDRIYGRSGWIGGWNKTGPLERFLVGWHEVSPLEVLVVAGLVPEKVTYYTNTDSLGPR